MKLAIAVALCLALTGCTSAGPGPTTNPTANPGSSTGKDDAVERTMSEPDAKALVERYGRQVVALLGPPVEPTAVGPAPCQGQGGELAEDGRFYMQANYRVPLTEGSHVATLTRLRDDWVNQGYQVTDFRTFTGDEATVDVRNPADGVQISLISSRPPTAIAVVIYSPCVKPPRP